MPRSAQILAVAFNFLIAFSVCGDPGPMVLFSTNAAGVWQQEAYPVGNAKLGAMVYGAVATEQIQFNEETIWTGQPHDYSHAGGWTNLALMQTNIFKTNQTAFWNICSPNFMSTPLRQCAYQPAGVISLTFSHGGVSNYMRSLDLNTATANTHYDFGGATFNRDVFASAPADKVIVIRLTANQSGKIAFSYTFTSVHGSKTISTVGNDLLMHVNVTNKAPSYTLSSVIQFDARIRIIATGGTVTPGGSSVSVTNADSVTLLLSVASNFINYTNCNGNSATTCSNILVAAAAKTYDDLRQSQLDDYQPLFQRVVLDLGGTSKTNLPTGQRVKRAWEGDDPQLSALYFQMGRYLMIAGSRPGSQPLTLQGKWNDALVPSWESKMTININQEMNYWGAEVANLSECHWPMFDLLKDLSVSGAGTAKTNYNASGWVAHHNTDLWRGAAPINGKDGVSPTGGAWLCQDLWRYYEYTGDTNWLSTNAYPVMKSAAQFFQDFLRPHLYYTNWLVTCPSYSPEHDNPILGPNVASPTIDNDTLRDLFNNVISASQVLGVDATFRSNITFLRDKLPPDQIGTNLNTTYGHLQEWLENVDEANDTHRHCSHLVGLFPNGAISPFYTPKLAAATKVSTDWRGVGDIGWGKSWRLGLQNRLQNAAFAYLIHTNMLTRDVSTNLMFTDVNNKQVDGIFGSMCGIAEMLMQSQSGEIFLLPCLPGKWTNGLVSGLCARGGFQVDINWQSNKLVSANIFSKLGNTCKIRSKWPIDVKVGTNFLNAPMILPGLWQFPTTAGSNYTVVVANVFETENLSMTTSAGDTHQTTTNLAFSGSLGTRLNANAPGDHVTYTLTNVAPGTYRIRIIADVGANRARFQLLCGASGGALTNVGGTNDTYATTNLVYLLPTNSVSTSLLWTNMLTEFDCGSWFAPNNGNYDFKFAVADKNASSSGYALSFDTLKLSPIAPLNQPPTDISLSNSSVAENKTVGTTVGALNTTDPDAGNAFTYTLVTGAGDTDNASFTISSNALQAAASFDYETQNSFSIRVRSADQEGLYVEKAFTISVVNTNEAPTDISLSNSGVTENQPSGTAMGLLSTTDPDAGNTFTYTLVTGAGDTDNGSFSISGSTLQTAASFNYEAQNSFSIRVRGTDQSGLYFEKAFTIAVTNTNEAPTDIFFSNGTVTENQPTGTTVGSFATSDPDSGNTFTYSLIGGVGGEDSGSFTISGNSLQTAGSFDYETKNSYNVRIRTTDQGGLSFFKNFQVAVANTNEPPTDISLSSASVGENLPAGTTVGTFSTSDPDSGSNFTYALVTGAGDTNNASFSISSNKLQTAAVFDFETQSNFTVRIRSTDQGGLLYEKAFAIVVDTNTMPMTPVNLAPADGSAIQSLTPMLHATAFDNPASVAGHRASQWLIRRVSDDTLAYDSGESMANKTNALVPGGVLEMATLYNWQTRYQDSNSVWSLYSTPTFFSTPGPMLTAIEQEGQVIISWPTNIAGFSLESANELSSTNWTSVSPAPAIVDGLNLVTNAIQSAGTNFYRLKK